MENMTNKEIQEIDTHSYELNHEDSSKDHLLGNFFEERSPKHLETNLPEDVNPIDIVYLENVSKGVVPYHLGSLNPKIHRIIDRSHGTPSISELVQMVSELKMLQQETNNVDSKKVLGENITHVIGLLDNRTKSNYL